MHYFARFKCHMDTDRNHYKAIVINIAKRSMFQRQKTVKQVFKNGLNEKISPMFDDHLFACLGLFKALSIQFVWELKWSKSFVLSDLASYFFFFFFFFFVFGYQVDAIERAVQKVCGIFLKLWSYGTGTFTLIWMGNDKKWRLSK